MISNSAVYNDEVVIVEDGTVVFLGDVYPFTITKDKRNITIEVSFKDLINIEEYRYFHLSILL